MQASLLKRTSATTALAIAGVLTLALLLAAPAHAQIPVAESVQQIPEAGGTLDKITDPIAETGEKVGETTTKTGGKVGDAVTDTGATAGDAAGGSTGKLVKDTSGAAGSKVKDTSGAVGSTVKDVSAAIGSTVDGTTKELSDGINQVTRVVDETLDETGVDLDGGKKGSAGSAGTTDTNGPLGGFPRVPDRLDEPSVAPVLLTSARGSEASAVTPAVSDGGSAVADAVRRALEALEKIAFPLALTLLVLAYLGAQGWFDRRDPKLALAAVDPDAHLLKFE